MPWDSKWEEIHRSGAWGRYPPEVFGKFSRLKVEYSERSLEERTRRYRHWVREALKPETAD
jgi:hypothetical protein